MPYTRQQEPWARQAIRGVGWVVGMGLIVLAVGSVIMLVFALAMGQGA